MPDASVAVPVFAARAAPWVMFAVLGATFFLITAGTFASIGVVLPLMIAEFAWSWTDAGAGFSILALAVGLTSTGPAWVMRRFGIKVNFACGGSVMTAGFMLMALTHSLQVYFLAAVLLGLGFSFCATVPAVTLLNAWMPDKRSLAIGSYMTLGALGAIAGPLIAAGVLHATGSWRIHWWTMAAAMAVLTCTALATIRMPDGGTATLKQEARRERIYRTESDWRFAEAIRTPQYWTIAIAMTAVLLCTITMTTFAFTHLMALGLSASVAAAVLSADGGSNAVSRAAGGALASRVDPKLLLIAAIASEGIGMVALAYAHDWFAVGLFVIASGFGFGMSSVAVTMLLLNYYGGAENPEILGTLNLITTAAMVGPVVGGFIKDKFGGFVGLFEGLAAMMLLILAATALMRPPLRRDARPPMGPTEQA